MTETFTITVAKITPTQIRDKEMKLILPMETLISKVASATTLDESLVTVNFFDRSIQKEISNELYSYTPTKVLHVTSFIVGCRSICEDDVALSSTITYLRHKILDDDDILCIDIDVDNSGLYVSLSGDTLRAEELAECCPSTSQLVALFLAGHHLKKDSVVSYRLTLLARAWYRDEV